MNNPILQALNKNGITNIMNILKGNPQSILNVLAKQNPQVSEVIKYVNNNGGNAKECFYKLAKEKGIDPNEILKMIK